MASRLATLLASKRPLVMGILNVTPDSFSDGGSYQKPEIAVQHARRMLAEGADIIDIGGESTRPGAEPITEQIELDRVVPVVQLLRSETDALISVDTSTAAVMQEVSPMCDLINDVRALTRSGAIAAAADSGLPICLMHMRGEPKTMQDHPVYDNLISDIINFFSSRIVICEAANIDRRRLLVDPGFGFGKTPEDNLILLNRLAEFLCLELPILVGLSRKSTISKIVGSEAALTIGSVVGAMLAINSGASIVRVHDVAETVAALSMALATKREQIL
ncbi:MAG: dihydropteroate synthase [Pseudomonadales bacterium]|nr:dihydropteroate synthase [Pseudomonadales bacterium]